MGTRQGGISGDYRVGDPLSAVAVAIVGRGSVEVPDHLFNLKGRFKTENMGIERIVANVILRPEIRHMVVCGHEEFGHFPGGALVALVRDGVDGDRRIKGCRSPLPFLCNLPMQAIDRFRRQVDVVDLVHPKDVDEIIEYDLKYEFEEAKRLELIELLSDLELQAAPPLEEGPIEVRSPTLDRGGGELGAQMNKDADDIVSGMLAMPSERLSTHCPFITVDQELNIILDPVSGLIKEVPSLEFIGRLRSYLTGDE